MVTGELKTQIDAVWNDFWAGGIANPLEVMEQLTYLLFIKGLDERQTLAENMANRTGKPIAVEAFAEFLDEKRYSSNQIEFVNLIIGYLTDYGTVEPGRVYDSPFTSVAPEGPEGLFGSADVTRTFEVIDEFTKAAA